LNQRDVQNDATLLAVNGHVPWTYHDILDELLGQTDSH